MKRRSVRQGKRKNGGTGNKLREDKIEDENGGKGRNY